MFTKYVTSDKAGDDESTDDGVECDYVCCGHCSVMYASE